MSEDADESPAEAWDEREITIRLSNHDIAVLKNAVENLIFDYHAPPKPRIANDTFKTPEPKNKKPLTPRQQKAREERRRYFEQRDAEWRAEEVERERENAPVREYYKEIVALLEGAWGGGRPIPPEDHRNA